MTGRKPAEFLVTVPWKRMPEEKSAIEGKVDVYLFLDPETGVISRKDMMIPRAMVTYPRRYHNHLYLLPQTAERQSGTLPISQMERE
jgi:hypothetical protein